MINVTLNFSDFFAHKIPLMAINRLLSGNIFSNRIAVKNVHKYSNVQKSTASNEGSSSQNGKKNSKFSPITGISFVLNYFNLQHYSLHINCNSNIVNDVRACIKDNYTNTITPILFNNITKYNFTLESNISASRAGNRFSLVFVSTAALFFNGLAISGDTTCKHVKLSFNTIDECEMNNHGLEYSAADAGISNQNNELKMLSLIVKMNVESS
jgi:hypothetical protein